MNIFANYTQHDLLVFEQKVKRGDLALVFHQSFPSPRLLVVDYATSSSIHFAYLPEEREMIDLFIPKLGQRGHSVKNCIVPGSPLVFEEVRRR